MKTPYFKSIGLGILLLAILSSCETDVELEAPYQNTPVIIGVLDLSADTQFVRINKAFLGAGNAEEFAQIRDSSEYPPEDVEAWLYKKFEGAAIDSIQLERIVKPSRDPGVFYNTDIAFYYTDQPLFTNNELSQLQTTPEEWSYEMVAHIQGETYRAETDFPDARDGDVTRPPTPTFRVPLYSPSSDVFLSADAVFRKRRNTARYQGLLRLNFDYTREDGTTLTNQQIDFQLGIIDNQSVNNPVADGSFRYGGENWFNFVGEKLKEIPGIRKVRIENLELRVSGANETLNTYINLAQPISDFTPVTATFTNFDNGAIGILGSKTTISRTFRLDEASLEQLNISELTTFGAFNPCYCVQDWTGSEYVCTESLQNCP